MTRTKKRTVITNRRRFFTFLLLLAVCVNILFIYIYLPKNTQADAVEKTRIITVCAGDTLWSIAEEHVGESDIRNSIYEIKKLNELKTSELTIGQELLVPVI